MNEQSNNHRLVIGNTQIDALAWDNPTVRNKETDLMLYMKRGNRFYFKNSFGKKVFQISPPPKELIEMKYGTIVNIEWS
jgi:hypothetical protein